VELFEPSITCRVRSEVADGCMGLVVPLHPHCLHADPQVRQAKGSSQWAVRRSMGGGLQRGDPFIQRYHIFGVVLTCLTNRGQCLRFGRDQAGTWSASSPPALQGLGGSGTSVSWVKAVLMRP
jgi:hypothetical protein